MKKLNQKNYRIKKDTCNGDIAGGSRVLGNVFLSAVFLFGGAAMEKLITTTIDPKQELDLVNYIDEVSMVVKPALRILHGLDEDAFNMDNDDLRCLLMVAMDAWDRIDEIFLKHNRKVKGLPQVSRRNIWGAMMPPEGEKETTEKGGV